MTITKFLDGSKFDPEARRVMSVAFEMTCAALRYTKRANIAHESDPPRLAAPQEILDAGAMHRSTQSAILTGE
jgi:hypothetical protein